MVRNRIQYKKLAQKSFVGLITFMWLCLVIRCMEIKDNLEKVLIHMLECGVCVDDREEEGDNVKYIQ